MVMTPSYADANAFHQFEYEGWQHASDGYHRYLGSLTMQTIDPLLAAVSGPEPKSNLLDIATGPGYVAAEAKRRGWSPVGVDFAEEMVTLAQRLHPDIDFQVGDASALTFGDSEFSAAVMNFGILHLAQPENAVREAYRILQSGGLFAFTVWAKREEAPGFGIALRAVEEFGDPGVKLPPGPPFFRFSDPAESIRVMESSGFRNVAITQLPLNWKLDSPADVFEAFYQGSARTGGLLRAQSPSTLAKIRVAMENAAASYRQQDHLEIPMPALVVCGRKPNAE